MWEKYEQFSFLTADEVKMARTGCCGLQITEFRNSCSILYGREAWSVALRERHKKGSQNSLNFVRCPHWYSNYRMWPCSVSEELLRLDVHHRLEDSKCLKSLSDNLECTTAEKLQCIDTLSFIGQTGRPSSVQCNFMEDRENTVPLRCRDGNLNWK